MFPGCPTRVLAALISARVLAALVGLILVVPGLREARAQDFHLVTGDGYAPFADSGLPGGGIATQIVTGAFSAMGKTVDIAVMSWARAYEQTRRGDKDATFPYVASPGRLVAMRFSHPIFTLDQRVYLAVDRPFPYHDVADLAGRTLCLPPGYAAVAPVTDMIKSGRIPVETPARRLSCIRMLVAGRVDFILGNDIFLAPLVREAEAVGRLRPVGDPLAVMSLHLVAGLNTPHATEIIDLFNTGLDRLKQSGAYAAIIRHALGS